MALIKCPECGQEISEKALKCPKCGVDLVKKREEVIKREKEKEKQEKKEAQKEKRISMKRSLIKIAKLLILVLIVVVVGIGLFKINGLLKDPDSVAAIYGKTGMCLSHNYIEATCQAPETCKICGKTKGEAIAHNYEIVNAIQADCENAGEVIYKCSMCGDSYKDVTEALGHKWQDATCKTPKTCTVCGKTEGSALGHTTISGICERCGEEISEPVEYTGSGDSVIENINIPVGIYRVKLKNVGKSNFAVKLYDNTGRYDLLANVIGDYTGEHEFNGELTGGMLEITSSGEWDIVFERITQEGTSKISGKGDCITHLFKLKSGVMNVYMKNAGNSNFAIWVYDETGKKCDLLVNEIGDYEGNAVFNKGEEGKEYYLAVVSKGTWSVDFGLDEEITTVTNEW